MKLKSLIQHLDEVEVKGSKEIEITGLCCDSRLVAPGNLFVAKKGHNHDGSFYIPDAISAGAAALLTDIYNPFLQITQLIHPKVTQIEAKLAKQFFHHPSASLPVIGVTGTNGKTTVTHLIKHILDANDIPCGLIGGIEWIVGKQRFSAPLTTADVITNHRLLREMLTFGCKAATMEVSSHALDQNRVDEIDFKMAVFTNFTRDHLDYHKTIENYRLAKAKLFERLSPNKWAILNQDDPASFHTKGKIFTYGIEKGADVMAKEIKLSQNKTQFILSFQGSEIFCQSPLIGKFNVYNLLAAISAALCYGLSLKQCVAPIKSFCGARGRLQRVKDKVFVDHAHSEEALKNVLKTLKNLCKGRVIVVFGCGGNRDPLRRPSMGRVATEYADVVIVTSDNPRSEDPETIAEEIVAGCTKPITVELDREKAIRLALMQKKSEDIVLIAGKGHEKEQIFAHHVTPFDDVEIVKKVYGEGCAV